MAPRVLGAPASDSTQAHGAPRLQAMARGTWSQSPRAGATSQGTGLGPSVWGTRVPGSHFLILFCILKILDQSHKVNVSDSEVGL